MIQRRMNRGALLALLIMPTWASASGVPEPSRVYDANCALCHQKAGVGLPGQFPRLAGRVGEISTTAAGRRYLTEVVLFGMAGKLEIDGTSIIGVMPSFAALSDDDIASALNYVIGLDGPSKRKGKRVSILAEDIKGARAGEQLSPTQVRSRRDAAVVAGAK